MKNKGFTLIELLVVIAVIGLLASIVLVSLGPARKKARDARRQSDIRQINLAMEMCYDDSSAACNAAEKYIDTTAGANTQTVIGTYMLVVPKDPLDVLPQQYTWIDGTAVYYCVHTKLEAVTGTYICASNQGVATKAMASAPDKDDCCGPDLDGS